MDIYDYLKKDHEKVRHLFNQFEKSTNDSRKAEIAKMIADELLVHAKSEQETFYKALQSYDESAEDANHGKKEHKEITDQIQQIQTKNKIALKKEILKLKDLVKHHVHEEEHQMFKHAKKVLPEKETMALKERMHYYKLKLLKN